MHGTLFPSFCQGPILRCSNRKGAQCCILLPNPNDPSFSPPPPESCHYWSSRKSLKRLMEFCEDERAKNLSWARDLFHGLPNGIRGEKSFLRMQVAAGQTKAAFRKFRRKKNLCCFPEIGSGPASFFAVTIWPNIKENAPPPISRIWPCRPSPFSKKKPWPVVNRPFKKKKNAP